MGFFVEVFHFSHDAPAIAAQLAVGAYNAVTGHDVHHRVGAHGLSDRTCRFRAMDSFGNVEVGGHLAGGNLQQVAPHVELEGSAVEMQAEVTNLVKALFEEPGGLFVQLHASVPKTGVWEMALEGLLGEPFEGCRHQEADPFGCGCDQHASSRRRLETVMDDQWFLLAQEFLLAHGLHPNATWHKSVHCQVI